MSWTIFEPADSLAFAWLAPAAAQGTMPQHLCVHLQNCLYGCGTVGRRTFCSF